MQDGLLYYCSVCGTEYNEDVMFCNICRGKVKKRMRKHPYVSKPEISNVAAISEKSSAVEGELVSMNYTGDAFSAFDGLNDWELTPSKTTFEKVRRAIFVFVYDLQSKLETEKNIHIKTISDLEANYKYQIDKAKKELVDAPNAEAQERFKKYISSLNTKWFSATGLKTYTEEILKKYDRTFEEGIMSAIVKRQDKDKLAYFDSAEKDILNFGLTVESAIERATESARKLKEAEQEYNQKVYDIYCRELSDKHKTNKDNKENEYRNKIAIIVNKYEDYFYSYFNNDKINSLLSLAKSLVRTDSGFTCSTRIPSIMFMGNRAFTIEAKHDMFYPEIIGLFRNINAAVVQCRDNSITICLPYFHTLNDGFSVYVDCKDPSSDRNQKFIKSYVLKMLMAFPAGQTRPLLLDNDSTTTLSMFGAIGESSQRGIITRPWVREEDIASEIRKIADERSKLSISYGDDIKSRLEREPIYFIAGRNFPKGFSAEALSQLSNIFLAGSKNGFFGLIQANAAEAQVKANDHDWNTGIRTIQKNSLHLVESENGVYIVNNGTNEKDVLRNPFTDMEEVIENPKDVISTIISGVSSYSRQTEKFEYLFSKDAGNVEGTDANNMNTWFRASADKRFDVPIGISGASTVQKFIIHEIAQHALISGVTGSGKSSLLRTIITSSMMKYTPENLNLYLIDFKEGVEFERFSNYRLPWIKAIALDTEREFALNILKDLEKEFKHRAAVMKKESVSHISHVTNKKYPRIIFVFDEVQELLRPSDAITEEATDILARLVSEGRAMNINIILTSQDFTNCTGLDKLKANMVIRIAFKGSPNSAKLIMGDDFSIEQLEQGGSGYAAINSASGAKGKTNFFQAGFLDTGDLKEILSKLSMIMQAKECSTRVMSSFVNQDRNNVFNRLICNNEVDFIDDNDETEPYSIIVGDAFDMSKNRSILLSRTIGDNLLVVGENEEVARSIFALSILSLLYDELSAKAERIDNELIRLIDLSDEDEDDADYFEFLKSSFDKQINRTTLQNFEEMVNDTYEAYLSRKRKEVDTKERLFLMFFGIDNAMSLYQDMYETEDDELDVGQKLKIIIEDGPKYGINCIIWTRSLDGFRKIFDKIVLGKSMMKRMFFGDNKTDCEYLIGKSPAQCVIDCKAVLYKDMNRVNSSMFRPYILPDRDWVESIAEVYKNLEKGLDSNE